jgi:hypothetical protein
MTIATSLNKYWDSVDAYMQEMFGIDTADAGIDPQQLIRAHAAGITPEYFGLTFGDKHGLMRSSEFKALRRRT